MATGKPETRKTHVTRIFGTNRSGELVSSIWVDVERIDAAKSVTQTQSGYWQGLQRKFRWMDDPRADDYSESGNPARKEIIVKVCDPDSTDINDPDEWVEIRAIQSLKASGGDHGDQNYMDRLINDETAAARVVEVRKIGHYDTNIDDDAQAAADAGQKMYAVDSDNYQKDLGSKTEDVFVDHEIVTYLKHRTNNRSEDKNADDANRGLQTKLLNEYLIDASDDPSGKVVGANGINPPYRLDPYQNIVNVQFGTYANRAIIVTNSNPPNVHTTKDGWNWVNVGHLLYGSGGLDDLSAIVFGGYRRDIKKFVVSGVRFTGLSSTNLDMVSEDGFAWSSNGADMDPELSWSYSEKPKLRRVVNGYVYRVAGGAVPARGFGRVDDKRYLDPTYARVRGNVIQRCANLSAKEDDDGQSWETVLAAGALYATFGPIQVIKGSDDVPTVMCLVTLNDDVHKFGVISSRDGVAFALTFTGHEISHGGDDPVGFAAAHV